MKVKFKPEDFFVEEIIKEGVIQRTRDTRKKPGKFAVYKVEKKNMDTLSVMYSMAKILGINRDMFYSCGLKDKYSVSIQYVAVDENGFRHKIVERLKGEGWSAEFFGESNDPLSPKHIIRNFFRITLRDIHPDELSDYEENIKKVANLGFPNYFDEQRFGSARHFADSPQDNDVLDFIGKRIIKGDFEGALKIHFQAVSDHDRSRVKKFKKIMREKWGNWAECLVHAQDKNDFRILRYLVRKPQDFKGAFSMIDPRLGRLYLEVYQDFIFNNILADLVKKRFSKHYLFPYFVGYFIFPYFPDQSEVLLIKDLKIPLPHPNAIVPPEIEKIYYEALEKEGVKLSDFKSGIENIDFVDSQRNAWEFAESIEWKTSEDEYHEGRKKIELSFYLKKGVFATILIKSITPLLPVSEVEKKPMPRIYTRDGKEISVLHKQEDHKKKVIILPS